MSHFETREGKPSKVFDQRPEIIKVLLIEDNLGDARLVKEMLADAGARIGWTRAAAWGRRLARPP